MDLSLTETQLLIKESTSDFVSTACDKDTLLDLDLLPAPMTDELWGKIAGLGWMGMMIPEAYGGTGNTYTDVAVLFEELGRGPVPGPMFSSGVLAASIILEAGTDAQKKAWLPELATGERIFAVAVTEQQYGWTEGHVQMTATVSGADYQLSGVKLFVQDAASATDLLIAARVDGDVALLRIDAKADGVSVRPLTGFISGGAEVIFDKATVSGADRLEGGWTAFERALLPAIPILCAYKVGACGAVYDMSVNYSRERTQFGQAIGRFQRVQDHIIHIVNYLDAARWTTFEALWKLDSGMESASSVHMAKAVASDSYIHAVDYGHEVHAGIGVVREYGLTMHSKMSRSLFHFLGAPTHHRKCMERALDFIPA
ncbi:MAG: acyl-CoA/acyl-ACP dehydrogenase [Rhodospirillaceae bacterium]|jgi:alkylation response protein AidB-like acyl-CoA dehydrogenase|nr:acyl-CoA/acyl-ACP dehydrogenase [Rhodospirillaceae bacterium]MBT5664901.1 acyl-CoA/acyl-ACP dehydrogenase [Rhodospirillaceae bacterium]